MGWVTRLRWPTWTWVCLLALRIFWSRVPRFHSIRCSVSVMLDLPLRIPIVFLLDDLRYPVTLLGDAEIRVLQRHHEAIHLGMYPRHIPLPASCHVHGSSLGQESTLLLSCGCFSDPVTVPRPVRNSKHPASLSRKQRCSRPLEV